MVSGEVRAAVPTAAPREAGAESSPAWEVFVGERFIAAFAAPAPARVALAFTEAANGPTADLEDLVGRIPLGPDGVETFALMWWPPTGDTVTAVVRGDAAVDLASPGGRRRLDASGIRPWHLADFRDVIALRVSSSGAPLDAMDDADAAPVEPSRRFRARSVEWHAVAGAEVASPEARGDDAGGAAGAEASAPARSIAFRIAGGELRRSAVPVLIGRRPSRPLALPEPVELIRVEGGTGALSATHLELRLEGGRIVATDLRSTNGTVVRTGSGTRRMRAGESIVVAPGTVLELGGDTIVEILPTQDDQAHPDRQAPA
ncbi:FHA domain-containing protein [Agromyces sp. CFH 90414]|uniref:FHA domain-containing protein n=1 Tax=Agromyces agglutinans TaxID=2662258 RepID=A0A6I2FFW9_9MICO|nr:FHA domain-containing protein [Agromyces agglutinans]MRG61466.1 FHA domain-containing protein [Agromyces agglutinans]